MRLGLLDFADLDIAELLACAQQAEAAGFVRYWLAEHHTGRASHADPLLMAALVAGVTERLRVGSGGVLLRYRVPLAVCNSAVLLAHSFPDRIDLGLAAGSAGGPFAASLADGREVESPDAFDRRLEALTEILGGDGPVRPTPRPVQLPACWVLGGAGARARRAGELGLSYCLSLFHHDALPERAALSAYRSAFRPSPLQARPAAAVAVAALCADSEREAARRVAHNPHELARRCLHGSPARVITQIAELAHAYDVDEVIVLECSSGAAWRRESIQLLGAALPHGAPRSAREV